MNDTEELKRKLTVLADAGVLAVALTLLDLPPSDVVTESVVRQVMERMELEP